MAVILLVSLNKLPILISMQYLFSEWLKIVLNLNTIFLESVQAALRGLTWSSVRGYYFGKCYYPIEIVSKKVEINILIIYYMKWIYLFLMCTKV